MAISSAIALVGAATAATAYNGHQQTKATERAGKQAQEAALNQEKLAEQANNKANQKRADPTALLASAMGKGGQGGTMLTGPNGIDPAALQLGKNTLLGS